MFRRWAVRYFQSFSIAGLLIGTLFFAASLTPTLIPRNYLTQGVLSGCSAAAGYGVGFFLQWLWRYLELPEPKARFLLATKLVAAANTAEMEMVRSSRNPVGANIAPSWCRSKPLKLR